MLKGASIALFALFLGGYIGHLATMKHIEMKLDAFAAKQQLLKKSAK